MESKYDGRRTEPPYVTDAERELEDCREAQKMLNDTYEEVFDERDQLRARNAELEAELEEQKEWSARVLQTREQFSKELGQCHDARKNDYERIAALEAEVSALESELAIAKEGIEAMTGRIK